MEHQLRPGVVFHISFSPELCSFCERFFYFAPFLRGSLRRTLLSCVSEYREDVFYEFTPLLPTVGGGLFCYLFVAPAAVLTAEPAFTIDFCDYLANKLMHRLAQSGASFSTPLMNEISVVVMPHAVFRFRGEEDAEVPGSSD
nr:E4 protein [Lemur mastadenovirus]WGN96516.1 E4 protein [Lemur mastadenovirus]WGN96550.1 E4 protein [Lemur mastadenovirus]